MSDHAAVEAFDAILRDWACFMVELGRRSTTVEN
ncbi:hypothetical protein GGR46_004020 [Sphingomonas kyeonggiensis]|uniref:Uncharacterized protein n=1 Tax=Sphingomonas kyeonggiensis TaxID=1268553 RepID=A0A7W6NYK3_9SPHN|nr:hypothetical protein [Sphingomonas kyeonggiensis]